VGGFYRLAAGGGLPLRRVPWGGGAKWRSVLGGGVERVVLVVLVWRVAGKQQRSRLRAVPAETEREEHENTKL